MTTFPDSDHDGTCRTGRQRRPRAQGRLLLIEDEALLCRTMVMVLRMAGFRVEDASNGQTALAALQRQAFDAVIVDMYMPDCDGLALIHEIRSHDPAVRVVAMSADPRSLDALRMAPHLEVAATLAKPFTARELLDTLACVLSGS